MSGAEISVTLLGGVVLAVVLAVFFAAAAFLSYRNTVPPLPVWRRTVLTILRTLALLLLALMFCEPVLRIVEKRTEKPLVAVLLDDTESMRVSGREATGTIGTFLENARDAALPEAGLLYYTFAGSIVQAGSEPPESLSLTGQTTNISTALAGIGKELGEENIRAVVLVSDGNYNEGRNPLNELQELGVPVFTVGVGDTQQQKDILIDRVYTNTLAYAGSTVPADVDLHAFGYGDGRVEVTIREGDDVLDRTMVTLTAGNTEYPLRLTIPAGTEGTHRYVVSVQSLPGELTTRNNSRTVFLKVLRSRIRTVLFAGAPTPDVSAMAQAVREDPQLEIRTYVMKSPGTYIGAGPAQSTLDSADCFIFVDFPSVLVPEQTMRNIEAVISRKKTPLFYVHGKSVDYRTLGIIEPLLPFTVSGRAAAEDPVFATVPDGMKNHPLIANRTGELGAEVWENLPPVFKMRSTFREKPGSEVLATARLQNFPLQEPLVVCRNVGGMKSLAITGHAIYRWRLMAQGSSITDRFFPSFISHSVRWLTTRENEKPVRVRPEKEIFTTAEEAVFRAEVYDEQLKPVDNAEVTVEISDGERKQAAGLQPLGNGIYEGSFGAAPAGDYTFSAVARSEGRTLGTDDGKFTVGQVNVEYLSTSMDGDLLVRIAGQSGGEFFPPGHSEGLWASIGEKAHLSAREDIRRSEIQLWNWGYLGAFVVFLLALEWFFRKRWALL